MKQPANDDWRALAEREHERLPNPRHRVGLDQNADDRGYDDGYELLDQQPIVSVAEEDDQKSTAPPGENIGDEKTVTAPYREVGEGVTVPVQEMERDPQVAATIDASMPPGQTYSDGKENGLWAVPDDEWRSREEIDKHEWVPAGELVGENNTEIANPGESQSAGTGTSATASTRDQNADDLSDEDQESEGKPLDEELPSKTDQNSDDLVDEVEGVTYREVQKGTAGSQNNDDLGDDGDKLLENVTDIGDPPIRQGSYRREEGKYYQITDALDSNADDLFLVKDDDGGMWKVSTESNAIVKDDDLNMWRVPEQEGRGRIGRGGTGCREEGLGR